jgi:hypothetical protein
MTSEEIKWLCHRLRDPKIEYIGKRIEGNAIKTDHVWLHEIADALEQVAGGVLCGECLGTCVRPAFPNAKKCPDCNGTGKKYKVR